MWNLPKMEKIFIVIPERMENGNVIYHPFQREIYFSVLLAIYSGKQPIKI